MIHFAFALSALSLISAFASAQELTTNLHEGWWSPEFHAYVSRQNSAKYGGDFEELGIAGKYQNKWIFGLDGHRYGRQYNGGAQIVDEGVTVNATRKMEGERYLETQVIANPGAEIIPQTQFTITPHQAMGAFDLGIGLDFRQYRHSRAGGLHPSLRYDLSSRLAASVGVFIARTESTLMAYHGDIKYRVSQHMYAQAGYAGGETLEDAGLNARFTSAFLAYRWKFKRWGIGFDYNRYWSNLRQESSFGIRLELR